MITSSRKHSHKHKQPQPPVTEASNTPEAPMSLPTGVERLRRNAIDSLRVEIDDFYAYASLSEIFLLTETLRMAYSRRAAHDIAAEECAIADAMTVLALS